MCNAPSSMPRTAGWYAPRQPHRWRVARKAQGAVVRSPFERRPKMLHAIDADTHLFESTQVWDFIDEEMYPRRPIIVSGPKDTVYKRSGFWLIDGNIFPKSAGKGGFLLGTPTEPGQRETTPDVRARELLDIPGRLQAMDLMGVATQVVYPTLFLAYITDDVTLEVALGHSYNRFMAGVWEQAQGRLRWVVVPPLRSIDASIAEINFAKERLLPTSVRETRLSMAYSHPYEKNPRTWRR